MLSIGNHTVSNRVVLAPMAGVTDQPFRTLCRELGAALAIGEMVTSDQNLWHRSGSRLRMDAIPGGVPHWMQIVGAEPDMMAEAAAGYVDLGADIIDINMGCPAKKVCNRAAGAALLREPDRVERILRGVVAAVEVPVTLKMRTGWTNADRNGVAIARMAEQCGIAALTVHGRTGEMRFNGHAEYDTIAEIKRRVRIPVIANGDIDSPEAARAVLDHTGADGVMVGRAALGRPWLVGDIDHYLRHGERRAAPTPAERARLVVRHLAALHEFHGAVTGVRLARKHVAWYLQDEPDGLAARQAFNRLEAPEAQIAFIERYYTQSAEERNLAA